MLFFKFKQTKSWCIKTDGNISEIIFYRPFFFFFHNIMLFLKQKYGKTFFFFMKIKQIFIVIMYYIVFDLPQSTRVRQKEVISILTRLRRDISYPYPRISSVLFFIRFDLRPRASVQQNRSFGGSVLSSR